MCQLPSFYVPEHEIQNRAVHPIAVSNALKQSAKNRVLRKRGGLVRPLTQKEEVMARPKGGG